MKENMLLLPEEEIRPIVGYEGLYSVTSKGRVLSYERIVRKWDGYRTVKARFLKPGLNKKTDYLIVNLSKDNKRKIYSVHRLEAIAFIENPNNLPQVNHKDGIKTNNYKDNLEWCTHEENMKHASKNRLFTYKHHSKFYGVSYYKGKEHKNKPWRAFITVNKKHIHIGVYKTELEAAIAYNVFVVENNLDRPLNKFKE